MRTCIMVALLGMWIGFCIAMLLVGSGYSEFWIKVANLGA